MTIPFPTKPWEDGEEFKYVLPNGESISARYNQSKNAWSFTKFDDTVGGDIGSPTDVTTQTVRTIPLEASPGTGTKALPELTTQYDVNWWLVDNIAEAKNDIEDLRKDSEDGEFNPDLEAVLTEGNAADKTILLSDGTDALVSLLPDEASIIVASDTDKKNPRVRLTHIDDVGYPNSQMQIELDANGTRADFEFLQSIESAHFNFDGDDKFVLNKTGDAEFTGKVQVEPGTTGNEVVTYQQLKEIEEEIEDIVPSLERGNWEFIKGSPTSGKYCLLRTPSDQFCQAEYVECIASDPNDPILQSECLRKLDECKASGEDYIDDWLADHIVFNPIDSNSVTHQWDDVEIGEFIEVINIDGSGFALYEITDTPTGGGGGRDRFPVTYVRGSGTPNGNAKVKLFALNENVNPTEFVHKTGDTMTGKLSIEGDLESRTEPLLYIKPTSISNPSQYVFQVYSEASSANNFLVQDNGELWSRDGWVPTHDRHLTPKKFVDDNFLNKTGDTMSGRFVIQPPTTSSSNNSLAIFSKDDAPDNQYSIYNYGKLYTPENGSPTRDIIFYTTVNGDIGGGLNWEPSKSYHLANKKYVDKKVGAPAPSAWKVMTSDTNAPLSGEARFDGTSIGSSTKARINFTSRDGYLDLYDWVDNAVIYSGDGSHFMLSAYYTGSDTNYKWKHKGFGNITEISTHNRNDTWYFLVTFGTTKIANGSFNSGRIYYFTIPGLF